MTKRLLGIIPLLIGITFMSFTIMRLAPGDPTSMVLDPHTTEQDKAIMRKNLGLDQPIWKQYVIWVGELGKGNLGYSFVSGQPVTRLIKERLGATLLLSVSTLIVTLLIALPLGLLSGAFEGRFFDKLVTFTSFIGMSIPTFWLGLLLLLCFAMQMDLLPTSGLLNPLLADEPFWIKAKDVLIHLILPLSTLVIGSLASLIRYQRFGVITILNQDYIKAAKARGFGFWRILFKHAFKNSALPLITILGLELPSLVSGAFVTEYIFAWPGMGQLGVNAVFSRDYPVIMGILLFTSCLMIFGNLLADIAYKWVDPRVRDA
jgi:peptide/nickel transport system permease protein